MQTFMLKRGDTSPAIKYSLQPARAINLVGASVRFQMRAARGDTIIDAPADVVSEDPPVVGYSWQAGDTDEAGRYEAEFRVENLDGTIETFPNKDFIEVNINPDIPDLEAT